MAFDGASSRRETCSLESEQALLGAMLFDNEIYHRVSGFLKPEHFFDPIHQLIFDACGRLINSGRLAAPTIVDTFLSSSEGFREAGGRGYLESLAANVPATASAHDYARVVFDLAVCRGLIKVGSEMIERARETSLDDDPARQIEEAGNALAELAEQGLTRRAERLGAGCEQWLADAEAATGALTGIASGLGSLDRLTGGFQPGELFVVAGRSSMGKSAVGLNLARAAAICGYGVHIASMEMERKSLWARLLSDLARQAARIPYAEIGRRRFLADEAELLRDANAVIAALPISVDCQSGPTAYEVAASARRAARKFARQGRALGLIVVDYLQLIQMDRAYASAPHLAIGLQTKAMKGLAQELGCTVLLLSQLNRAVESRESKRPNMADLRQSGAIEEDADKIGFVLRPEYYVERDDKASDEDRADARGIMKLFLDKNRNGPTEALTLDCDISCNAVRDKGELYPDNRYYRSAA